MVEIDIFDIANGISLIGTCLGLFSRVPQGIEHIKLNQRMIYQRKL